MKRIRLAFPVLLVSLALAWLWSACDGNRRWESETGTPTATVEPGGFLFRFTVANDFRGVPEYETTLLEIVEECGNEGLFHVTPGDYSPAENAHRMMKDVFGEDVLWYPVLGNHDTEAADLDYVHSYVDSRIAGTVNPGPTGTERTAYSWTVANAHFIVINQYYDGVSETGTDGDVTTPMYDWLKSDVESANSTFIFVFGHEPAYPNYRHVGDSLDRHPSNRDRFWALLEEHGVTAHFVGHTHRFSLYTAAPGGTVEINCGRAAGGVGEDDCFADVNVHENAVVIKFWRNRYLTGEYSLFPTVTLEARR